MSRRPKIISLRAVTARAPIVYAEARGPSVRGKHRSSFANPARRYFFFLSSTIYANRPWPEVTIRQLLLREYTRSRSPMKEAGPTEMLTFFGESVDVLVRDFSATFNLADIYRFNAQTLEVDRAFSTSRTALTTKICKKKVVKPRTTATAIPTVEARARQKQGTTYVMVLQCVSYLVVGTQLTLGTIYATHWRWNFHSLRKVVRTIPNNQNNPKDNQNNNNNIIIIILMVMASRLDRHLRLHNIDGVVIVKSMQARDARQRRV